MVVGFDVGVNVDELEVGERGTDLEFVGVAA